MLPANMFGATRLNTLRWKTCSPCSRTSGIALAPGRLALLPERDVDAGVAIGIAVDVPLEAEIDERRMFDHELAGRDRDVVGRRAEGRRRDSKACGQRDDHERAGAASKGGCEHRRKHHTASHGCATACSICSFVSGT